MYYVTKPSSGVRKFTSSVKTRMPGRLRSSLHVKNRTSAHLGAADSWSEQDRCTKSGGRIRTATSRSADSFSGPAARRGACEPANLFLFSRPRPHDDLGEGSGNQEQREGEGRGRGQGESKSRGHNGTKPVRMTRTLSQHRNETKQSRTAGRRRSREADGQRARAVATGAQSAMS